MNWELVLAMPMALELKFLINLGKVLIPYLVGGGVGAVFVYWQMYRDSIRPEITILRSEGEDWHMEIEPLGSSLSISQFLENKLQAYLFRKAGRTQVQRARQLSNFKGSQEEKTLLELQSTFLHLDGPQRQKGLLLAAEGMVARAAQPGPLQSAGGLKTQRLTLYYFLRRDIWEAKEDRHQSYRLVVVPEIWLTHLDEDPDFMEHVVPFAEHASDRLEHIRALHSVVRGKEDSLKHCYKKLTISLPTHLS